MSGQPGDLDRLIKESEEAIQRLDAIQKARHNAPLLERVRNHFARNKAQVTNLLLAGTVLAVAMGRLGQKQEHEVGGRVCIFRAGGRVAGLVCRYVPQGPTLEPWRGGGWPGHLAQWLSQRHEKKAARSELIASKWAAQPNLPLPVAARAAGVGGGPQRAGGCKGGC